MSELGITLRISKVGDREAMTSLNLLDQKGQQVVENIAGRTGKSLGAVASAYTRASAEGQKYFQQVAASYQKVATEEARAAASAERSSASLEGRQAHSVATMARGLEMVGRTGQLTGRSLDAVMGQVSQLAFGFGPQGALVGAVGIATAAVVELFMRTSREAKKMADETIKEFNRIAHMNVKGQGEEASLLYSGDPFDVDPNSLARFGLPQLQAKRANLARRAKGTIGTDFAEGGTMITSADARKAHDELEKVTAEIARRQKLLSGLTGPNGTLVRAGTKQAADDLPGFITDAKDAAERAARKYESEADRAAKAYAAALHKLNIANAKADIEAEIEATHLKQKGEAERAGGIQNSLGSMQAVLKQKFEAAELENAVNPGVQKLADYMQKALSEILGGGIVAGFEAAFAGEGITASIGAFASSVLGSLGGFLEQLGAGMIVTGSFLSAFADAMWSLDGPAALAAGVGLIAAGAAMKAIGSSFGKSHGSASSSSYGGSGLASITDRGIINMPGASSARDPSTIAARPSITFAPTIIGPNDPGVLRGMDEILRKLGQQGSLAGLAWQK